MLSFWSWSKLWVCAFSFTKSKLFSGLMTNPVMKKEKSPPKSSSLCVSPVALLRHIKQMCGEGDVLLPGRTRPDWWRTRCAGGKERLPRAEVLDPEAAGTELNQPPFIRSTVHCCNSWQENDSHIIQLVAFQTELVWSLQWMQRHLGCVRNMKGLPHFDKWLVCSTPTLYCLLKG